MNRRFFLFLLILAFPSSILSQSNDTARLTLDRIYASSEFHGDSIPQVKWLAGGAYTTTQPSKVHEGSSDLVRFEADGKYEVLVAAEKLIPSNAKSPLSIDAYELSKDMDLLLIFTNTAKVWRANTRGDYWLFRRSTNKLIKLGGDINPSTMMFAKLSPDGASVGYVHENNIYIESIEGGSLTKLTSDGSQHVINGTFDWVYEEEFFCRDGWRWSPDSKQIAYWQLDTKDVKTYTLVDNTQGSYQSKRTFAYPKTGERNSKCRVGVVSVTGGETKWMNVPGNTSTDFYIPRMEWIENPKALAIRRINRLQNTVDVMLGDTASGNVQTILTERENTWVDIHDDAMHWVKDGKYFTWISERDGWRHLYLAPRDGGDPQCVTKGEYDVIRVLHIDEKSGYVYFSASPENPTQQYLYRAPLDGSGKAERLSPEGQTGWHDYAFSPEGTFAVHTYSSFGKPPRVELISIPDHKVVRTLASNEKLQDSVSKLAQTPVEFFRVDVGSGGKLDGWLMKPAQFDPNKKYPIVFHVYGEPWGQEVTDRWGGSQYLWHLMLTQQGYAVACVDNRGTPCPRGKDWRKAIFHKIGTLTSHEQALAATELLKRPYLDASRVGVWGWSGGGSLTLNLMFRYPDLYRTGMAVAPVPDMKLYDTIYQERYMGLPQDSAEDYKRGSPINYAEGLKGNLLIVHGTGDDNCHYQGTELLANKLIELNKPFTLMSYPNRTHSINEGRNTTRHLFGLLTRYLNDNLAPGPKP